MKSPQAIFLPVGINYQETLEQVAKNHIVVQAVKYIRERKLFKGTPTVKKFSFSMIPMYSGEQFHLMVTMNNRGGTAKNVVFQMHISREDFMLIHIKSLEKKMESLSYTSHTHDWR